MLHLAMLKVLFLSTTLAVDAPRFDHFGFQCTASSYLSERQLVSITLFSFVSKIIT